MQALVLSPRALLGRGRQFRAARLVELAVTPAGCCVLTRQESAGKWSAATYSLIRTLKEAWGS
jgi:hypothetical protein